MQPSDPEELFHLMALTMVYGVGPKSARAFLKHYGTARKIFQADPEELKTLGDKGKKIANAATSPSFMERVEKEMDFIRQHHVRSLSYRDPEYPLLLKECDDAPIVLHVIGMQDLRVERCLSVVGTRKASSYGRDMCREVIREISCLAPGTLIVSGLAYGIDIIAHRAALEFGLPTVAVLGHGLNTIYPASHRETARQMLRQGALVSDFHSGMGPERNNFLRRNRIIAGLSQATLVVESAEKGGALITASQALSYNRDVLALPGRAGDHRSVGCNNLIKRNIAAMVTEAKDILLALNWEAAEPLNEKAGASLKLCPVEEQIIRSIHELENAIPETISKACMLSIPETLVSLLNMELKGWIESEAGNRYRALLPLPGSR